MTEKKRATRKSQTKTLTELVKAGFVLSGTCPSTYVGRNNGEVEVYVLDNIGLVDGDEDLNFRLFYFGALTKDWNDFIDRTKSEIKYE